MAMHLANIKNAPKVLDNLASWLLIARLMLSSLKRLVFSLERARLRHQIQAEVLWAFD